jgi:hypothetical protein
VRIRVLAPVALLAGLVLAPSASAAVLCVGTSGGDCTQTYPTTDQAVAAAIDNDTIRFGAGTFDPVNTPKVLTYEGVGAGTPDSAAGATVIRHTTAGETGMTLPNGGTVRNLRAEGGPNPGGMGVAGEGIVFAPTANGDMSLTLVDVIATGGTTTPPNTGGVGLALGGSTTATGTKVATIVRGAFLGSATPGAGGMGVYSCCIESTFTDSLIRTGGSPAVYASIDSRLTLQGTTLEGVTGVRTQGPTWVRLNRSRIDALGVGMFIRSEPNQPTDVSVRDSLLRAGQSSGETGAAVTLEGDLGDPVTFSAVGSTLTGRGTSNAVSVRRAADGSASVTTTLRNSIARAEGTGADLVADRATIDAAFSSFNTRSLLNGGSAPDAGTGSNVAGDPMLAPDFTLLPGSPLIDRGDPSPLVAGELDLAGAARSLDGNGDCVTAPDIGAFERPNACVPPNVAPVLTRVSATNRVFAPVPAGRKGHAAARKRRVKRGTRFRYTLSEPAKVRIRIERVVRRNGKRRYRKVTVLSASKQAGRSSTRFTGRVRRRALKPGRYRARLVAVDAQGARSAERRLRLRIVRP